MLKNIIRIFARSSNRCFTVNINTCILHIFTSEDMKKYVTREKRAFFRGIYMFSVHLGLRREVSST